MHAQITAEHMTIGASQFLLVRSKGETNSAAHVLCIQNQENMRSKLQTIYHPPVSGEHNILY